MKKFIHPEGPVGLREENCIYLDDSNIEVEIYPEAEKKEPTPADIFQLWLQESPGTSLHEILISILINNTELALMYRKETEAGRLIQRALRKIEDEASTIPYLLALYTWCRMADTGKSTAYKELLEKRINRYAETLPETVMHRWQQLLREENDNSLPYQIRTKALEKLESGHYAEALHDYNILLKMRFEPPGTLCHLARVQLMTGNEGDARRTIAKAWRIRKQALPYVVPRILFYKILFAGLDGTNPARWVDSMVAALQDDRAFNTWSISTLLQGLQPKLPPECHILLTSLAGIMQDCINKPFLGKLNEPFHSGVI